MKSTQAFNEAEYRRREKNRRFGEAAAKIPQYFLLYPLLCGTISWLVLNTGSCFWHAPEHGIDIAHWNGVGQFYTFGKFLVGAGTALFFGTISFLKRL